MIELLLENHILLLFIVSAIGYSLGEIKIGKFNLGIAAVLFTGLFFGSLHPDLKLPEFVYILGLVLFVYTIGLSNGPGFYNSLKLHGVKDNLFSLSMILVGLTFTVIMTKILSLKATLGSGLFVGSFTNTPALASLLDYLKSNLPKEHLTAVLSEPVIAYSVTYPFGVIGPMIAIYLCERLWKINYEKEAQDIKIDGFSSEKILNRTIKVTKITEEKIYALAEKNNWNVIFSRIKRNEDIDIINEETLVKNGDLMSLIGSESDLDKVITNLGVITEEHLEVDRSEIDFRRIFVSNYKVSGLKIENVTALKKFGAIITRIRRGDIDLLAKHDSTIELGDRIRVVAPREKMDEISKFFGDSYKALSEINVMTFGLGIALGLLLGSVPIPLPNGTFFKLGFAGGPLIAGLTFGILGRTGNLIWNLPYSANLTLRQLGLILFLAGIGTRSGYAFVSTFAQGGGVTLFLAGAIITFSVSLLTLFVGYKLLKIPMSLLIGMFSGIQTQPALLGFSCERTKNDLPNIGYSTVYPISTISKIILVQVLYWLISS